MKKILVLKVGTSTLTSGTDKISRGKIEDIARQIVQLKDIYDFVLVSSGAIATARQFINIDGWDSNVASKQAMAAIGQPKLIQIYNEVFSDFNLKTAQCLMTYRDFENESSRNNTSNTIRELLKFNYIPIINENDTTAIEELVLGDNDKLSALVATLINADLLILASDIDGVYDKNPHLYTDAKLIPEITNLAAVKGFIEERKNNLGTGGMTSKIQAAEICLSENVEMYILNGARNGFIVNALSGNAPKTRFIPASKVY